MLYSSLYPTLLYLACTGARRTEGYPDVTEYDVFSHLDATLGN